MTGESQNKIVTFYSYKGGTGRTMMLANVAWIMAAGGCRVLVVDWDLEAPGLDRFLHPFLDPRRNQETPGVLNLITEFAQSAAEENIVASPMVEDTVRLTQWIKEQLRIDRAITTLDWKHFPQGGRLDYMSAGKQNLDYSAAFAQFDWNLFYELQLGGEFFRVFREELRRDYDYVLIDSRTGLSDVADVCTITFPDLLVDCFTLNDQSIDGAAAVAERVSGNPERPIRVLPVPMRVEDAEADRLEAARTKVRHKFNRFLTHVSSETQRYWGAVEVPYKAAYAYEEILAAFRDVPGSPASLLAACERLTGIITDGAITELPPVDEELRRTYLDVFTRRQLPGPIDLFLSYVPEDRMWADWIAVALTDAGFAVRHERSASGGSAGSPLRAETERHVESASRTVAVLSTAYQNSVQARAVWESVAATDPMSSRRALVPVRISDVRLRSPFSDLSPVDLAPLEEESARQALLRALDAPLQPAQHPAGRTRSGPRYPGTIPPVWSVPLRNASFTGRVGLLDELRERLEHGVPTLLHGMGGVGKTQLALEYAHRFMTDYDVVWWIRCESLTNARQKVAELAEPLRIPASDSISRTAEAVRDALRRGAPYSRWLLIFDNADDAAALSPLLVSGGGGHVIITSRQEGWEGIARQLEIDVFDREESVDHLVRRVPAVERSAADKVAERIGDLPIAVDQAAAWLNETALGPETYLEILTTGGYPLAVAATWMISIDRLQASYPIAVRLLEYCSFFGADPISLDLLYGSAMVDALRGDTEQLDDNMMLARAIQELSRFALVKVDRKGRSLQIHRLVQESVRASLPEERQKEAYRVVHGVLAGARPSQGDVESPENWGRYATIWPHIGVPWTLYSRENRVRRLMVDRMRDLRGRGELLAALTFGEDLVESWTPHTGENDRWTLHMRFEIANVLRAQGWYERALEIDEDVLQRQATTLGDDDLHTLMTASSVSAGMRGVGRFHDALELDRGTRERFVRLFGEDHPRSLMAANNYAVSLRMAGQCFDAAEVDRKTLDVRQNTLGPDHPLTFASAINLGRDLRSCGNYAESLSILQNAYERAGRHPDLGTAYPPALNAAKALALTLRRAGRLTEAERYTQEVLDICRRTLGDDSPETLVVWMGLAGHWAAGRRFAQARDLLRRLHGQLRTALGDSHPLTLACANNYAVQLLATGEAAEAGKLVRTASNALDRLLGPEHPFSIASQINLANTEAARGDTEAAEERYRKAIAGLTTALRPVHPSALLCNGNLGLLLLETDRAPEGAKMHRAAVDGLAATLGADHPRVALLRERQRVGMELDPHPI